MSNSTLINECQKFIKSYLQNIRHITSSIPDEIRINLPQYLRSSFLIEIIEADDNGIAVDFRRLISNLKKPDSYRIKKKSGNILHTLFPNRDYSKPAFMQMSENSELRIEETTLKINGTDPFFSMATRSRIFISEVRFETTLENSSYPREKTLVWIFCNVDRDIFSENNIKKLSEKNFWNHVNNLFFNSHPELIKIIQGKQSIEFLIKCFERLLDKYTKLISRQDLDEELLQQFLEKHIFLLTPDKPPKKEKRKIGSYLTDFTLTFPDKTRTLVELQLNTDPIFFNGKPSSGLKEAV